MLDASSSSKIESTHLASMLDGPQSHLDLILPGHSQIQYLGIKWPSKIEARWGNFDFREIRYLPAASSGSALKSKLAESDSAIKSDRMEPAVTHNERTHTSSDVHRNTVPIMWRVLKHLPQPVTC